MKNKYDTVVFDLDGTLVNTAPDFMPAVNHVMDHNNRASIKLDDIVAQVGAGARAMIAQAFKLTGDPILPDQVEPTFELFLDYYVAHTSDNSHPYEGCIELLQACKSRGMKLAVCTNKIESMAVKLLNELDMSKYFDAIVGLDTFATSKPDGRTFIQTVERVGNKLETSIMVGDTATDIQTAKNAGAPVIALTLGYSQADVSKMDADFVVDHHNEIASILFS